MTIKQFKDYSIPLLKRTSPSALLDVEVLLQFYTGLSKTQLLLRQSEELTAAHKEALMQAVEKRLQGLPVAYIINKKEFFSYDFYVNQDVLIPKPDTELLVEKAIDYIIQKRELYPSRLFSVCDMCTGSGCIGLSVIKALYEKYKIGEGELPLFLLADISEKALAVAKKNAELLLPPSVLEQVRFVQTNLFEQIPSSFDFILTNPPYIPSAMVDQLLNDGRSEPRLALDGDFTADGEKASLKDGLGIIRTLLPEAKEHLNPGGIMIMETGEYNALEAEKLARELDFKTELYRDYENQLRGFVCN